MGRESSPSWVGAWLDRWLQSLKSALRSGVPRAAGRKQGFSDAEAAGVTGRDETTLIESVSAAHGSPTPRLEQDTPLDLMTTRERPTPLGSDTRLAFAPGDVVAERYRIVSLLGRGGMGAVYRADDLHLGGPVALKFLAPRSSSPEYRIERLVHEVQLARQISHPSVCRVHDIGTWNERRYISMEYIDGED